MFGDHKYGAFSVYNTDAKRVFLGLRVENVYTRRCAKEMAEGILKNSNATIGIAVTGNAMPYPENKEMLG
jgi:nicotinamide mononucleotide (NMN) deamidase PncC